MKKKGKESPHLKCPFCDGDLIWGSDSDASDVCGEYEEDDAAVVSYYLCSRCGRDYEIFEPRREDREGAYKEYWNHKK